MLATFAGRIGEQFNIAVDDTTTLPARLTSATPGPGTSFSLVFTGPPEPVLPQRIYRFDHDQLDALVIFIVPIGRDDTGVRYEAVFN